MGPPSTGGNTVGESLNINERFDLPADGASNSWHYMSEDTEQAYADRGAYIGDNRPGYSYVPITGLLSDAFAAERAALISPTSAMAKPVPPGNPCPHDGPQCVSALTSVAASGLSTTHLTTADRWGNVVAYTLTIEATGGTGITVPGWGFLLNNELTDFDATGNGPNLPAPGKRPRSSMAPTIVLDDGEPMLALGSPGGSTIITTVIAVLMNRIDGGMNLGDALAAPRSTQRNTGAVQGEAEWVAAYGPSLQALGHSVTTTGELGAATAIEMLDGGRFTAAAEPVRRGGGAAGVVTED
jgi:gamma-glutamyltranspeptidase/glutathione hydrolase